MTTKSTAVDTRFCLTFIVQEKNMLLRTFLNEKEISKRTLTAIKYNGGYLTVNGVERDVRYLLQVGDRVDVTFPLEEMGVGLVAQDGSLDIIYEDEAILMVNKPAGMSTIPSQNHLSNTIANYVAGKFVRENIPATVHVVTRLDYNTSGLICIAKNRHIHHLLGKQMMQAEFDRRYEAIVEGHVEEDAFMINKSIGRKDGSIIERVICSDGKPACTEVFVQQRFDLNGKNFTKVQLTLHTGRTHQIRVHLQSIGHPLAGDDLYGGERKFIARQALHCARLQFKHPLTDKQMKFVSALPNDMNAFLG